MDNSSSRETHTCQAFMSFSLLTFLFNLLLGMIVFSSTKFMQKCLLSLITFHQNLKYVKFPMELYCTVDVHMHGMTIFFDNALDRSRELATHGNIMISNWKLPCVFENHLVHSCFLRTTSAL